MLVSAMISREVPTAKSPELRPVLFIKPPETVMVTWVAFGLTDDEELPGFIDDDELFCASLEELFGFAELMSTLELGIVAILCA